MNKFNTVFRYTKNLKIIVIVLILFSILNSIDVTTMIYGYSSLFQTIIDSFFYPLYLAIIFISMVFVTIETIIFNIKDCSYLIRFKNRDLFLENLFKMIFKRNFLIYSISFFTVVIIIATQAFLNNCLISDVYRFYQMPDYIYLIFMFFKVYLIFQLFMTIITISWLVLPKKYFLIFILISVIDLFVFSNPNPINKLSDMNIHLNQYLIPVEYSSLMMEICASSLYCIILIIIIYILNSFFKKKNIDIGG